MEFRQLYPEPATVEVGELLSTLGGMKGQIVGR